MRLPLRNAALLLGLFLAGCGHSPATTFLALEPAPPASAVAAYRGPPVRVPFLHVPITLDRPEFVRQVAGTVKISDFDRWAAPLGLLARNTLIEDLQARLPAGSVLPPDAGARAPELRVEPTVLAFRVEGGEAVMDATYALVRPPARGSAQQPGLPRPMTLSVPLQADTPAGQAQAWSALLGRLADRIVTDIASGG